jgi:peptide chain release factor 1
VTANKITVMTQDVRTEWFSGTGAGGQHRNKHQNSCRLIHVPTGTVATAQCRKRDQSYTQAWADLERRIQAQAEHVATQSVDALRNELTGSGMRADKVRTYRFQEDVVRDHVTGREARASVVMRGNFDLLHKSN